MAAVMAAVDCLVGRQVVMGCQVAVSCRQLGRPLQVAVLMVVLPVVVVVRLAGLLVACQPVAGADHWYPAVPLVIVRAAMQAGMLLAALLQVVLAGLQAVFPPPALQPAQGRSAVKTGASQLLKPAVCAGSNQLGVAAA